MEEKNQVTPLPEAVSGHVRRLCERYGHLRETEKGLVDCYRGMIEIFERGGVLFVCGNGGSFADAIHIKGELAKSFEKGRSLKDLQVVDELKKTEAGIKLIENLEEGLPVIVLGESHALDSAYGNDREWVYSYAQELNSFAARVKPAMLMGISTSGNAKNVVAAMTLARAYGITTVSFTGMKGGEAAKIADIAWKVPGDCTAEIQENQVLLYHTLCRMVEEYFFGNEKKHTN